MGPQVKNMSTRDLSILMIQLIVVYQLIITKLYAEVCSNWSCNFDWSTCNWTQATRDDFNWSRHSGGTSSSNTGPNSDHTSGRGFYMYIETSKPRKSGDKARLISPALNGRTKRCVVFYYHMNGSNINTLSVYFSRSGSLGNPVWSRLKSQGNEWKRATVQIDGGSKTETVTNIVIEGVRGDEYQGDIAFDDVSLTPGVCDQDSCFFDNGMCGWTNFDFLIGSGTKKTDCIRTVTTNDHTEGKAEGKYMYVESSRRPGTVALLQSSIFQRKASKCVTFYYHIYGATSATLRVLVQPENQNRTVLLWSLSGHQGNTWMKGVVPIPIEAITYRLSFEGISDGFHTGYIAVDDIAFDNQCPCDLMPNKALVSTAVPEILTKPATETVNVPAGDNITLYCSYGDVNPDVTTITWTHNGRETSGKTFHIQNVTNSDEGRLTCTAHNGGGTSPGRADVYIRVEEKGQEPPLVHIEPTSDMMRISEGENLTANCVVSDAIPNITSIEWLHNGRNSSGDTFNIQHVTQADEGKLTCTARNGVGTSPGRADTYIRVTDKSEAWTKITIAGVVVGVIAGLIIILLVVLVMHLSRKLRLVSGKGQKSKPQKMVGTNPVYDLKDTKEELYVNVDTACEAITQDDEAVYEEVKM